MLAVAAGLLLLLVLFALVLLSVGAWIRAAEARETLRLVQRRLAAIERQLGLDRPKTVAPAQAIETPVAGSAEGGPAPGETSLEERIALVWLARIGAGILVVGAAVFLFYGPTGGGAGAGRLAVAGAAGAAALAFAEVNRRRARPLFNQVVLGLGTAVLAFAAVASAALYHLAPPGAALAGAAAVLALGGALAVRHATEVPLVIPLLGALVAPALAWRGAPAPALFAWLFAVTAAPLAVAVWRAFPVAAWLAPLGGCAALAHWFFRSFDARPGGPDAPLAARAVPLLFAAAFAALWIAAPARARRLGRDAIGPGKLLVAGLLLAHLPFAALAWDQPPLLTAAAAALALVALWLLPPEEPWTLLPPLLLSFFLLLGADHSRSPALATFLPLAAWGLAYAWGLARHRLHGSLILSGIAGALFLVVAGELLAPFRWRAFGLVTVAWSFAYAWLAMKRRYSLLLAGTGLLAFFGLLGAALPLREQGDHVLLALGGCWVLVHLGGLAYRIRSQRETPDWPHIVTASGTGVAYGALVLFLAPSEPLVRGALAAGSGAAHVVLGGMLLSRSPRWGNALQAVAVGLFAAAAMHVLPGAYSTLAWAGLATLLVWAGFRRRSGLLRALGLGLFGVVIARVVAWDLWQRPLQVGVLFTVGAALLFASWLYARLGGRLVAVLQERRGSPPGPPPPAPGPDPGRAAG